MLLAASESAVTKKPRLRLTMRRSSSVRPFGSFQSWMSRLMLISCGIQWFAQSAMYFSQAHLYLKGTSWLTSALELMTCLSSTVTRRSSAGGEVFLPGPLVLEGHQLVDVVLGVDDLLVFDRDAPQLGRRRGISPRPTCT